MIQPEHYLPKEKWYTVKDGDRIQIERTDGTILEGIVKNCTVPTGFDIGPYYMAYAYIKAIKMIKAYDPKAEIKLLLAKAAYRADRSYEGCIWEAAATAVQLQYVGIVDAVLAEQKRIVSVTGSTHSESSCIPGVCDHDE